MKFKIVLTEELLTVYVLKDDLWDMIYNVILDGDSYKQQAKQFIMGYCKGIGFKGIAIVNDHQDSWLFWLNCGTMWSYMSTFIKDVMSNKATDTDIDTYVDMWHTQDEVKHLELHEFLGFSLEEYTDWMKGHKTVGQILIDKMINTQLT